MDYNEYDERGYEERAEENRERNRELLAGFDEWLTLSGLSQKVIEEHLSNVEFYINEYLNYYDVIPAEDGIPDIYLFLGDWFIRKAGWSTENSINRNIASLKKFYAYLESRGMIEESEYKELVAIIKDGKPLWIERVNKYNEGDLDEFFRLGEEEIYGNPPGDVNNFAGYDDADDEDDYDDDHEYGDEDDYDDEYYYDEEDIEALHKFYTSLKEFARHRPWEWLDDTNIFAMKFQEPFMDDDYNNENDTYFCSVLGKGGFIYGVSIYSGLEGIESFIKILDKEYDIPEEAIHIMNCVSIYFTDRGELPKGDYDMIKESGVKFKGKKQWPTVRIYEPGFPPRTADMHDIWDITQVVEALNEYVLYLKENEEKASLFYDGKYFLREYDENGRFEESIRDIGDFYSVASAYRGISIMYSELDVKRILKNCVKTGAVWEIDSFYTLSSVEEDDEVFFPLVFLIADLESGLIVGQHMTHPYYNEEFQLCFLEAMTNSGVIPSKVVFKNNLNLVVLQHLFYEIGIEIEVVDDLEIITDIKLELYENMDGLF